MNEISDIEISVIMPVYNVEAYLKETLICVLSQTFNNFELLVIDDKSTDNTLKIAKSFAEKDSRIKITALEKNKKQGYARNIGIQKSVGKYIMFIDGDDLPDKTFLEKMHTTITKNNSDISMCNFKTFDDNTGKILNSHVFGVLNDTEKLNNNFNFKDIKYQFFTIPHVVWNKIYNKSFIEKNKLNFQTDISICEDIIFGITSTVLAEKISFVDENLLLYRINRKNASSNTKDLIYFDIFKQYDFLLNFLIEKNVYEDLKIEFIKDTVYTMLYFLQKIKVKYKKSFYEKMQTYFRKYYSEELSENKKLKNFDITTVRLINNVRKNSYFSFLIKSFTDKIFCVQDWIGGKNIFLFSKFHFWVNDNHT